MNMEQLDGYVVFWVQANPETRLLEPLSEFFGTGAMLEAMQFMEALRRKSENQFVTMASQNRNSVGKPGVASIENGKTPDGFAYEWSKAGRAGKTKRSRLAPELKVLPKEENWIEP